MASANVTLGHDPHEFEVDTTQRTATLNLHGVGWLKNTHATETIYLNFQAATVVTAQPLGAGGGILKAGYVMQIPKQCTSFTFDAAGTSYCQYSPAELK